MTQLTNETVKLFEKMNSMTKPLRSANEQYLKSQRHQKFSLSRSLVIESNYTVEWRLYIITLTFVLKSTVRMIADRNFQTMSLSVRDSAEAVYREYVDARHHQRTWELWQERMNFHSLPIDLLRYLNCLMVIEISLMLKFRFADYLSKVERCVWQKIASRWVNVHLRCILRRVWEKSIHRAIVDLSSICVHLIDHVAELWSVFFKALRGLKYIR